MKVKNLIFAIIAVMGLTAAVSCSNDFEPTYTDGLTVSQSYIALADQGGSSKFTVNSAADWKIEGAPAWLTVSPATGSAGTTEVTLSADAYEGRNAVIKLISGDKTQFINIIQGKASVQNATCAEVIAGPDSKTYQVKGTVTRISNTTYGNWYINDGTGEVYVYGTLDKNGGEKNFSSLGIEVGDEVTIQGPKTTYNGTVELVNVSVVKITKSLIKIASVDPESATFPKEGGDITVELDCKGNGVGVEVPADAEGWLAIKKVNGNFITLHASANEGGARSTDITFTTESNNKQYTAELTLSQEGSIQEVTVEQFLAAEVGDALYKITGRVTNRTDISGHKFDVATYGNFDLVDATGNVYIYGVMTPEMVSKQFGTLGVKEGDIITIIGKRAAYKDSPQMGSAYYVEHQTVAKIDADCFNALDDDANAWYELTGTVTDGTAQSGHKFDLATYGNFDLVDATGSVYVYGLTTGWGGPSKSAGQLGLQAGDVITIVAHKSSYKGSSQAGSAWFVSKAAAE